MPATSTKESIATQPHEPSSMTATIESFDFTPAD
jgi:hypothetical protein